MAVASKQLNEIKKWSGTLNVIMPSAETYLVRLYRPTLVAG